jgi:hypothetical protein
MIPSEPTPRAGRNAGCIVLRVLMWPVEEGSSARALHVSCRWPREAVNTHGVGVESPLGLGVSFALDVSFLTPRATEWRLRLRGPSGSERPR